MKGGNWRGDEFNPLFKNLLFLKTFDLVVVLIYILFFLLLFYIWEKVITNDGSLLFFLLIFNEKLFSFWCSFCCPNQSLLL